jgi:hypothetical protein
MFSEPDVSAIVPSNDPHSGSAFPPRGPRGEFPRFSGTARCSDSLPPSGRASSPSRGRTALGSLVAPRRGEPACLGPGLGHPGAHRDHDAERQGLPGSWASPMPACPAPGPRWNLRVWPRSRRGDAAFRCCDGVGFHGAQLSGLTHAACALPVYASQRRLPDHHATLGSGWWPAFAGRDWRPAGTLRGFPSFAIRSSLPPSPGFAWRNTTSGHISPSSFHWSSTSAADDPTYAWVVGFYSGGVYGNFTKGNTLFVRAVRGGL